MEAFNGDKNVVDLIKVNDEKSADDEIVNADKMGRLTIGFGICGSFCTFSKILSVIEDMAEDFEIIPVFSDNAAVCDTRFTKAEEFIKKVEKITGNGAILSLTGAEPIGPKKMLEVLVIAPCTGNTIAKIANGIADTPVTLAVKSQLRNNRPVVIAPSTNDGLGGNAENIGRLFARKNIYFVPFGQDDFKNKENSLVADFSLIKKTVYAAMTKKQFQPVLI